MFIDYIVFYFFYFFIYFFYSSVDDLKGMLEEHNSQYTLDELANLKRTGFIFSVCFSFVFIIIIIIIFLIFFFLF